MASPFFTTGLPAIGGDLGNMPLAGAQGIAQGMQLAKELALLDQQIKQQQMATTASERKMNTPFFQEFNPGTTALQFDPITGQPTGKRLNIPMNPLQQAHARYYEAMSEKPQIRSVGGTPMQFDPTTGSFLPIPGTAQSPMSKLEQLIAMRLYPGVPMDQIVSDPTKIEAIQSEESRLAGVTAGTKETAKGEAQAGSIKSWSPAFIEKARAMGFNPIPGEITPTQILQVHNAMKAEQGEVAGLKARAQEEVRTASPRAMFDRDDAQIAVALGYGNPLAGAKLTPEQIANIDKEKERRKLEFAATQAGAKAMTPEQAGRMTMMTQATSNVNNAEKMLFPDGKLDRGLVAQASINVPGMGQGIPGTPGRDLNVMIEDAVSGKYRIETGAAGNQAEVQSIANRFKPSMFDTEQTIRLKLAMLRSFMETSIALTDPTGTKRLTGEEATQKYQQAVDLMFQQYGIPTTPQSTLPRAQVTKPAQTVLPKVQEGSPSWKMMTNAMKKRAEELSFSRNPDTNKLYTDDEVKRQIEQELREGRFDPLRKR